MLSKTVFLIIDKMAEVKCGVCVWWLWENLRDKNNQRGAADIRDQACPQNESSAKTVNDYRPLSQTVIDLRRACLLMQLFTYFMHTGYFFSLAGRVTGPMLIQKVWIYFCVWSCFDPQKKSPLGSRNSSIGGRGRREHVRNIQQAF